MPYKDKNLNLKCNRDWYAKNKIARQLQIKKRLKLVTDWFIDYKSNLKCSKCPENHPACLEFHHINPNKKDKEISRMVGDGLSIERIKKEIDKCMVLCSNCHRKLHFVAVSFNSAGQ